MVLRQLDLFEGPQSPERIKPLRLEDLNVTDIGKYFLGNNMKRQKNGNYKGKCIFHVEKIPHSI